MVRLCEILNDMNAFTGTHRIELHATLNFSKVSLYTVVNEEILETGILLTGFEDLYNTTFEVPQGLLIAK